MDSRANNWKQQRLIGWVSGLFSPVVGLYLFCKLYFEHQPILDTMEMFRNRHVIPHVISLSVLVNLVLFFTFLRMNREQSAHGVLGATFLYVFVVIYMKFFA
ncbi:MAG: hypothetical protein ACKO1U_05270 [Bacteroidota bacterium]